MTIKILMADNTIFAAPNLVEVSGTNLSNFFEFNPIPNTSGIGGTAITSAIMDSSGNLYVGGYFNTIDGVPANNIAKWNGSTWSAMGTGADSAVYGMATDGTNIYIGGYFTSVNGVSANRIAKWNGSVWSSLGTGMNNYVRSIALDGSNIYAGGSFTTAGGTGVSKIAKWNGSAWSAVGSKDFNYDVYDILIDGSNVYIAGNIQNGVYKWNGSAWSAVGDFSTGQYGPYVNTLAMIGSTLYAGGSFTNRVAYWTGSAWNAVGSWTYGVSDLVVNGTDIYAIGTSCGKWNGSAWSVLGSETAGSKGIINAGILYVCGNFKQAGSKPIRGVAQWTIGGTDDTSWNKVSANPYPTVPMDVNYDITESLSLKIISDSASNVYVSGGFDYIGGTAIPAIAKCNPNTKIWSSLGDTSGWVIADIACIGTDLYACGNVGIYGNTIVKWNGSSWSEVGTGSPTYVSKLFVDGSNIYVIHNYSNVSKWDGSSWTDLNANLFDDMMAMAGYGYALTKMGTDIYVAGQFTAVGSGSISANNIAKWNGSAWSAMGTGANDYVADIIYTGLDIYISGRFTSVGGSSANKVARWNGSSWTGLGTSSPDAITGFDLYMYDYVPDVTAPTPGNSGTITTSNVGTNTVTLNWTAATDDGDAPSALQYLAYYSTNSSMDSVSDIKANGIPVGSYE